MANRHRGIVEVILDGKAHQLRYTLNALAELEERLGLTSISEILETLKALSMRSLRTLLWAGLLHADPALQEKDVGEMEFEFSSTVARVSEAISAVFASNAAAPGEAAPPGGNARRPSRGAGTKRSS